MWTEKKNELHVVPKYPLIEHIKTTDEINKVMEECKTKPIYWNNYYWWDDTTKPVIVLYKEINLMEDYLKILQHAIAKSIENTNQVYTEIIAPRLVETDTESPRLVETDT